ncbi:MAG: 50S ribosomal protein L11 methyltransferase [Hyphomicrobiaceae bacterium]|nr:50S ribosomal protein L11 methyltransferase [Hyphomicrobiaceae bacterium]
MGNPPTYRITLSLHEDAARRAEIYLSEVHFPPADAVGLRENAGERWNVDAYFNSSPDMDALSAGLREWGVGDAAPKLEQLDDIDWVARSQEGLHPVRAGRFLIHGSHDRRLACSSRWAIEIDAGQAFGTAHHGSTLGCLRAIDELAKRDSVENILDIGTGSGILAIAAAKAWNACIIATDIDPVSVGVARENCSHNGVSANVRALSASGLNHPTIRGCAPYDLVIANILAKPLLGMAHSVGRALRPGGLVVLSGMTREQAGRVAAAYGAAGFARLRQITVSDWATLVLTRVDPRH